MPKVNRDEAFRYERLAYPGKLKTRTNGCWKTMLSDGAGVTQFGCGEVELSPGSATSLVHWHENEDEFVYILEGEVILTESDGTEEVLRAGDSAGWKAGTGLGHSIENRSEKPARLLEIGTRLASERAHYPGLDMVFEKEGTEVRMVTRDGRPLGPDEEVAATED